MRSPRRWVRWRSAESSISSSSQLQCSRCCWPVGKKLRRLGLARLRLPLGIGGALLAIALVSALAAVHGPSKAAPAQQRPNIILIGIDSLRLDQLQRFGGGGVTKHLDRFLAKADVVRDTTTPVARTYSSWTCHPDGQETRWSPAHASISPSERP